MDIIVTVPKSELKNIAEEREWAKTDQKSALKYWKVSRIPKHLKPGDRVYFLENGQVTCWQEFLGVDETEFECEVTERNWGEGTFLVLKHPVRKIRGPIMKGFRGFRYTERL